MVAIFKLKRCTQKRHRKYPRKYLNDEFTDRRNLKELSYCRNNWIDDDYSYCSGPFRKFFISRIGQSINKVFSDFVYRCSKDVNPQKEFSRWVKKEENIINWIGGFYVDNDILKYKKPVKYESDYKENQDRFSKLDLTNLIKLLYETHVPQCLGKYKKDNNEYTFYMDFTQSDNELPSIRRKAGIKGVGYGIDLNLINTQTGKTKYSIIKDWLQSYNPMIYFYYLNK